MNNDAPSTSRSPGLGFALLLAALAALAILSLPSLVSNTVAWKLPTDKLIVALALAASFVVATVIVAWRRRSGHAVTIGVVLSALAIGYAPTFLYLVLKKSTFSRKLLLLELAVAAILFVFTALLPRLRPARLAVLALAALGGILVQAAYLSHLWPRPARPSVATERVYSALYQLKLTSYRHAVPKPEVKGGSITHIGDKYLLATGDGDMYLFAAATDDKPLDWRRFPYHVPQNTDDFLAFAQGRVETGWFRTADILAKAENGRVRLFATHHFWKKGPDNCFVVRISELDGSEEDFVNAKAGMQWKTLYETSPCEPIEFQDHPPFFGGLQIGGRLALIDDDHLLVSLGDNGLDGWNVPLSVPQDLNASYGKTMRVSLSDGAGEIYSVGHRNPQGLTAGPDGSIWLTEHGPQGGDELNKIEKGLNYGYPMVTLGVEYGTHSWPFDPIPGGHEGFTFPYYAWIPSIGTSNVMVSNSDQFKYWKNDIIVSALTDRSLYRLRVRDSRVVLTERIPLGSRIRDIDQGVNGDLVLWTDDAFIMFLRVDNDTSSGEAMFDRCVGCHAIEDGTKHGFGPDLYKVVGRPVASAEGFQYSPTLRALGGRWTRERLDQFLTNPQNYAPGTSMQFTGIPEATSRATLIDFLASGKKRSLGTTVVP